MKPPVVLDLFCGAGGAGQGFRQAGFRTVGVDIVAQDHYIGEEFICADALDQRLLSVLCRVFRPVAVHASPVCKTHSDLKGFAQPHYRDQIPATRRLLRWTGLPYLIENVNRAPLRAPLILCGSMFALGVRRHRLFELGRWQIAQPECRHQEQDANSPGYPTIRYHSGKPKVVWSKTVGVYGHGQGLGDGEAALWRHAMGIDWMNREELSQAIPPAYTRFIGEQLWTVVR